MIHRYARAAEFTRIKRRLQPGIPVQSIAQPPGGGTTSSSPGHAQRGAQFAILNEEETMTTTSVSLSRKQLFLRACRGDALPRAPVWMMRQAGRYLPEYRELRAKHAFLEVCKTPDLAVEISMQPFRRLGVDAIIVFSDILIPAEAMGLALELGDAGPILPEPVRSLESVRKLRQFDPEMETGFLMEAIRKIVKQAGPEVAVLGFAAS